MTNQFPHPTKPTTLFPGEPLSEIHDYQEFHYPEKLQLPIPIRPAEACTPEATSDHVNLPPPSYPQHHGVQFSEPTKGNHRTGTKMHLSPSSGKTPKEEKEAVDELVMILVECMAELNTQSRGLLLRKFFSEIETEERLERFIVERMKQSRVKTISDVVENLPEIVRDGLSSDYVGDVDNNVGGDVEDDFMGESTSTRSLHETVEELSLKLERFKVRNFSFGEGVVVDKPEDDQEKK